MTVHVQRWREDDLFGHDFNRLSTVRCIPLLSACRMPPYVESSPSDLLISSSSFRLCVPR